MHCTKVINRLDDYLDGLLAAPAAERIRAHIERCAACEAEAGHARAAMESMQSWGDLEPPPGCFDRIMERIEALPPDALSPVPVPLGLRIVRSRITRWVATSGAAAAAVLLVGTTLTSPDADDAPRRVRAVPAAALRAPAPARTARLLPGERALSPAFFSESDYEKEDGLRRRRLADGVELPGVPVSLDALGTNPR